MLSTFILRLATRVRAAKSRLPRPLVRWLKRFYHRRLLPLTYPQEQGDAEVLARYGLHSAPRAALRHRVHGEPGLESFLLGGRASATHIRQGMALADVREVHKALDFGCGCGRTLLWLRQDPGFGQLFGTDIDGEATAWVAANLGIEAGQNQPLPPLDHADAAFDMLYSISVFTHVDASFQDAWFREFQRVVKPGGLLLISCHSEAANALLPPADQRLVEQQGLLFYREGVMNHVFPEFYQNTYHSPRYIQDHWGAYFEILGRLSMGVQDLVVMRNRPAAPAASQHP